MFMIWHSRQVTKPLPTWSGVLIEFTMVLSYNVYLKYFCACVVWNGTKEIRKNKDQITLIASCEALSLLDICN